MVLRPKKHTKNILKPHKIFSFDIETYGDMNTFYMGSVYDESGYQVFYNKEDMKKFILSKNVYRYKSYVIATNLMFDFFALFDYEELDNFNFIFRGSELLTCQKIIKNKDRNRKVKFIDTFHFASKISLKNLGKIIGIDKYPSPYFIGEIPNNDLYISLLENKKTYTQKQYLEVYNIRDSEITYKFSKFFENSLINMGGELKPTIASISINYFRLKYLFENYRTPTNNECVFMYKGYYGGRTEVFKRGKIQNLYYYDFNSLYPSVMLYDYPDPNTLTMVNKSHTYYINNYDGVTKVKIKSPKNLKIPLLPLRVENKLIFPNGEFIGHYSHIELRKAISLGYEIIDIFEGVYFTKNINIFKNFVNDNYNSRLQYKKEKNPIEYVYKIILNSLYGKFAQKYDIKQNIHFVNDFDFSKENVMKYKEVEVLKDFFVITKEESEKVPEFIQPIWSIYVTAYGRLKLYEAFEDVGFNNVFYCDTDSLITNIKLSEGDKIGELKEEDFIKSGIIIKPKFYEINGYVKAKGLKGFNKKENLLQLIEEGKYSSWKFCKLKETLRSLSDLRVNQKILIEKKLSFEDNKRNWNNKIFSINELQDSIPLIVKIEEDTHIIVKKEEEKQIVVLE